MSSIRLCKPQIKLLPDIFEVLRKFISDLFEEFPDCVASFDIDHFSVPRSIKIAVRHFQRLTLQALANESKSQNL